MALPPVVPLPTRRRRRDASYPQTFYAYEKGSRTVHGVFSVVGCTRHDDESCDFLVQRFVAYEPPLVLDRAAITWVQTIIHLRRDVELQARMHELPGGGRMLHHVPEIVTSWAAIPLSDAQLFALRAVGQSLGNVRVSCQIASAVGIVPVVVRCKEGLEYSNHHVFVFVVLVSVCHVCDVSNGAYPVRHSRGGRWQTHSHNDIEPMGSPYSPEAQRCARGSGSIRCIAGGA